MHTCAPRSCSYAARLPPSLTPSLPPARRSSGRPASDRDPNPDFAGLAGALAERAAAAAHPSPAALRGPLSALAPVAAVSAGGLTACGSPVLQGSSAGAWPREPVGAGPSVAGARAWPEPSRAGARAWPEPLRAGTRAWPEPAAQSAASLATGGAGVHPGGSDGMLCGARTNRWVSAAGHELMSTVHRSGRCQECCNAQMCSCTTAAQHMHSWRMPSTQNLRGLEARSVRACLHPWQTHHACARLHGEHQTSAGSGHVTDGSGGSLSGVGYSFLCLRYACACDQSRLALAVALDEPLSARCLCLATNVGALIGTSVMHGSSASAAPSLLNLCMVLGF